MFLCIEVLLFCVIRGWGQTFHSFTLSKHETCSTCGNILVTKHLLRRDDPKARPIMTEQNFVFNQKKTALGGLIINSWTGVVKSNEIKISGFFFCVIFACPKISQAIDKRFVKRKCKYLVGKTRRKSMPHFNIYFKQTGYNIIRYC